MTEKTTKRRQGQRGATPKTVCPKCGEEYLKTSFGTDKKKFVRIGQYCPNPDCDYIVKDSSELEEEKKETTEDIDKAEKIKKLTEEFMKTHDRLNELAEQIKELETE